MSEILRLPTTLYGEKKFRPDRAQALWQPSAVQLLCQGTIANSLGQKDQADPFGLYTY